MNISARQLTHNDKERASFLVSFVYRTKYEDLEKRKQNWNDEESEMWGCFVDNKLASVIYNNHFNCTFDDNIIPMSGIGGVATLPEYRTNSCISEIFKELLNESYKRGEIISSLYPFSHSFYRNFGYDLVPYQNVFTFSPKVLNEYKFNGNIILYEDGMDTSPYYELYNEFIKNYNFMAPRTIESFNHILPKNVFKEAKYCYLFKDEKENIAYVIYKNIGGKLEVTEAIWKNKKGFNAILSLMSRFTSDYEKIIMHLPINIDLNKIIHTRSFNIEKYTKYGFMVRIINVFKALEIMKKKDNTSFVIEVYDKYIKENNQIFKVTNNKVEICEIYNKKPDIKCSIESFSQLYVGALSLDELSLKEDFEIFDNIENIKQAFNKKPVNINIYF